MKAINPATNEVLCEFTCDTKESIQTKFKKAKLAQCEWKKTPLVKRIEVISKFCHLLQENLEELAIELCQEVGKPLQEARNEINGAIYKSQFFIKESEAILAKKHVNTDGNTAEFIDFEPLGVITNISAWNYPYLVGINIFVPALITGNAVLYKPSEYAAMVGMSIHKYMLKAGAPSDVFSIILGAGDVGAMLCDLPLDGYFFTGSYATGKKIAVAVADKLVPVGLELGGKDPLYITDEIADIKQAAESAAEGAFYNNGQSCCSVERIYVHEKVYDEFLPHFLNWVNNLKLGNPMDAGVSIGAITRVQHLEFLTSQVEDAISKGAKLQVGGHKVEGIGSFFEPTVLTQVDHSMSVMKEESFGPIIGIQKVKNDKEAIDLMNDTAYGLTSAVYTSNHKRGEEILSQINSGTGYLNCCDRVSGYLPWSGRGHSGLGSTLSNHGLYAFCHLKGYHIRTLS